MTTVEVANNFTMRCLNPDGSVAWEQGFHNMTTLAGLASLLGAYFGSNSPPANWYLGLIDNARFVKLDPGDTMTGHAGWYEYTAYVEGARQAWVPAVNGAAVRGALAANFTNQLAGVVAGGFLCSSPTLGGTSGVLWATGLLGSPQPYAAGQRIQVTYGCTGSGS